MVTYSSHGFDMYLTNESHRKNQKRKTVRMAMDNFLPDFFFK